MELHLSVFEMLRGFFTETEWIPIVAVCLLYCFLHFKEEYKKKYLVAALVLIVCLFNDVIKSFFDRVFEEETFYRFLWMIPMTIIVAYVITEVLWTLKQKREKVIFLILILVCILTVSKNWITIFKEDIPENSFLIDNNVLAIADVIHRDTDDERISAALPKNLYNEMRVYDADFVMTIGRTAYLDYYANGFSQSYEYEDRLIELITYGTQIDVEDMKNILHSLNAEYIVIHNSIDVEEYMNQIGCTFVDMAGDYNVYRVDKEEDEIVSDEIAEEESQAVQSLIDDGYVENVNHLKLYVPGIEKEYNYCLINDVHLWADADDEEVIKEQKDNVKNRAETSFVNPAGIQSKDSFAAIADQVDNMDVDGLILNADIIDQMSVKNISYMRDVLLNLNTPYMYLRSDHDVANDWTNYNQEKVAEVENGLDLNQDIYLMEEDEFVIMGINNSWKNISEEELLKVKEVFSMNKSVIIVTHVPYNSVVDNKFQEQVLQERGNVLLWGEGCYYIPDDNMKEYLDLVYAEDSPVVAVIAAHLHGNYEVQLTDNITEYIYGPEYEGNITMISIRGTENNQ